MTGLPLLLSLLLDLAHAQCPAHPCSAPFHEQTAINAALAELRTAAETYNDEASLRQALSARLRSGNRALAESGLFPATRCAFDWLASCMPRRSRLLGQALWEWDYLDEDQQREAEKAVAGKDQWERLSLQNRRAALADYLYGEARLLLTDQYASSSNEIARAQRRYLAIRKDIPDSIAEKIQRRLQLAEAADGIKKGLKSLKPLPENFDRLPLEERAALARQTVYAANATALFPLGNRIKRLLSAAQGKTPALTAGSLEDLTKKMLSLAWRTAAGKRILAACEETGCRVEIAIGALPGAYGRYTHREGRIVFNEKLVREWAALAGADISSGTLTGPELDQLALYLSPIFVHELTHLAQDAGETAARVSIKAVQEDEYEAAAHEAAYFMEQNARKPEFRDLFARAAKSSPYARAQQHRTKTFSANPSKARQQVMARYAYRPSAAAIYAQLQGAIAHLESVKNQQKPKEREKTEREITRFKKSLDFLHARTDALNRWAADTLPALNAASGGGNDTNK